MADEKEKLPLDARILSEAIIELNISRRNVSLYPRGHSLIEGSLNHAFDLLQKLFELRPEITLSVAKDTLIIDNYFLDKKNPVYREFALHLSKLNIAHLIFIIGLTKDELYEFHRFLSEAAKESASNELQEILKGHNVIHIKVGFVDYSAFSFREGETKQDASEQHLWERYVYGLLEGSLQTGDIPDGIQDIPPEILATILNKTLTENLKEESYDKVITTYIRRSSERAFSSKELKRLMDFINGLKPELKKQFLSSAFKSVPKDIEATEKALKDVSVDKVIELLDTINKQKVAVPEPLKILLEKFSSLQPDGIENPVFGDSIIADDIFISPDVISLLSEGNFEAFVTNTYQKEIEKLLTFDASAATTEKLDELKRECDEEYLERDFNLIILEFASSPIVSEQDYNYFIALLGGHAVQFLGTGQYERVLKILKVLESNAAAKRFPDATKAALDYFNSPEFITQCVDSFRIVGREAREEALLLCDYYGESIIPRLIDVLVEEDSQTIRKFFLSLISHFSNKCIPEAIKRLGDQRWFVKRNMLFILREFGGKEIIPQVRPYCHHENIKVSFEAIKCLLKTGDKYGVDALRKYLRSESNEIVEQAVGFSGAFKVREVMSDLIQLLKKKGISGVNLSDKIPVIRALGQIADPSALDVFRELLSSKSLLFKGSVEKLKMEIYMALKNFPYEAIKDMVEAGLQSKDEQIREELLKLKRQYAD